MPLSHKIAPIISGLSVLVWLIHHVEPDLFPIDPTCPAVAVFTVCEAVVYWQKKRSWAYILIGAAVVSMAFFIWGLTL